MSERFEYAQPLSVQSASECFFYHVMDLPNVGLVGGQWDLRETVDDYLGRVNFAGKRVLDVGSASGFLTFEMERRGASVVSFDSNEDAPWDIVPITDVPSALLHKREGREKLLKGYWLAHRVLGSRAGAFYGNVYALPDALGRFDVVVLGSILLHLRDPFLALQSALRLCHDTAVITDLQFEADAPVMEFLPNLENGTQPDTWWRISRPAMTQMLTALGFEKPSVTHATHLALYGGTERRIPMSTYVARRRATDRRGPE
jgi:SAM-dependent methyltransferase